MEYQWKSWYSSILISAMNLTILYLNGLLIKSFYIHRCAEENVRSITALMNFFKNLWMLGRGFSKKIYHAWKYSSFCSFWEKGLIWRKKTISDTHDWLLILDYFYTDQLPLDEASGWSRLHFLLFLRRATHEVIHYTVNWATVYWGFIKVLNTEGVLAVFVIS